MKVKNDLLLNEVTLNFNPFSGLHQQEMFQAIESSFDFEQMIQLIESQEVNIIQLIGKKGRGKTLHLSLLSQLFHQYPIFYLNSKSTIASILQTKSDTLFIDSIHHLGLRQRLQLYKAKKLIVLTSHWNRVWEYKLAGKSYLTFAFKGINKIQLLEIVKNRIAIAAVDANAPIHINEDQISLLIEKYKDNYRAILNHLYDVFQQQ